MAIRACFFPLTVSIGELIIVQSSFGVTDRTSAKEGPRMKRPGLRVVFAALLSLGSLTTLEGAITCSTAEYKGTYAFFTAGSFVQLPPSAAVLQGPFAQAGTFTSDGQGNVAITSTASYNGIILPANDPATYTVNSDCTIDFSLNLPPPLSVPTTFHGVLTRNNREMALTISFPPGTVVIGTHAKMDMRFCGVDTFSGSYGIDLGGSIASGSQAGLFRRVGRLVADGAGNFIAATLTNYNGQAVEENFSGTYTVSANCGINLTYSAGTGSSAKTITIGGYLGGHGDIAMVMVTTSAWAVSGTLKAQQP
jgi:hypothetical protein